MLGSFSFFALPPFFSHPVQINLCLNQRPLSSIKHLACAILSLFLTLSFSPFPSAHSGQSHFLFISILLSSSSTLCLSLCLSMSPVTVTPATTNAPSLFVFLFKWSHPSLSVFTLLSLSLSVQQTRQEEAHNHTLVRQCEMHFIAYWKCHYWKGNFNKCSYQTTDAMDIGLYLQVYLLVKDKAKRSLKE